MTFSNNTIVKLRNGLIGVVASFQGSPSHIIFKAYCNPVTQYDENLEKKNHEYDVVEIYNATSLKKIVDVWEPDFELDEKDLIWKKE